MNKLPLDGRSLTQKIDEAKELLQEHGFLVRGPLISRAEVETPAQLVRFFYDTMAKYRPQTSLSYGGCNKKERGLARKFIQSRRDLGVSKKRAIAECCELITLLFKYEPYMGLNFPVTNMSPLGQDNMSWVTEKLVNIYEGFNREVNEAEDRRWFEELYKEQEETIREQRLVEAREHLDEVIRRYDAEESKEVR